MIAAVKEYTEQAEVTKEQKATVDEKGQTLSEKEAAELAQKQTQRFRLS